MTDLVSSAGPWLWPLAAVAAFLLLDVLRSGAALVTAGRDEPPEEASHASVLVWGTLGLVVGFMGTSVGLARIAVGVRAVTGEDASPDELLAVLWDGALVASSPLILGLCLFSAALVAWLLLHYARQMKLR